MPEPRFFGREEQMRRLDLSLATALSGRGSIALVAGEAGSGKTALVEAFMSGARERHQDLAFAKGDCSALGGLGDPYLPFREILIALTAADAGEDTFARPAQTRLGRFFSRSAEILVEIGPDLIGTIIPGAGLAAVVGQAVADKTGLLDEVMRLGRKGAASSDAIEPGRIHEQYANSGADLRGADLRGARLARARLHRANLAGAILTGADLTGATGLTQAQLDQAIGDDKTTFVTPVTMTPAPYYPGQSLRVPDCWRLEFDSDRHAPER